MGMGLTGRGLDGTAQVNDLALHPPAMGRDVGLHIVHLNVHVRPATAVEHVNALQTPFGGQPRQQACIPADHCSTLAYCCVHKRFGCLLQNWQQHASMMSEKNKDTQTKCNMQDDHVKRDAVFVTAQLTTPMQMTVASACTHWGAAQPNEN